MKLSDGKAGGAADEKKPMTAAEEAWDLAKTVLWAVGIALVLRVVIFQPFNIPSGSMKPNLLVGDFLFVSKPAYGYSRASLVYPFTRMDMRGRILSHAPERGDVIVFKNQRDRNKDYIKRLVGLPGDIIQVKEGTLYINDTAVKRDYVGMASGACENDRYIPEAPLYRETLPNGVSYLVQECLGDRGDLDNTSPTVVPPGHYFFMGDNRDQSQDSRTGMVGPVPHDALVGKAERLFFSIDTTRAKFWELWRWPVTIRYGRILDPIE